MGLEHSDLIGSGQRFDSVILHQRKVLSKDSTINFLTSSLTY